MKESRKEGVGRTSHLISEGGQGDCVGGAGEGYARQENARGLKILR